MIYSFPPQYKGALVVSPITNPRHQVVGTVNVDSLKSYSNESTVDYNFNVHEINFHQVCISCHVSIIPWCSNLGS